MGSCRILVQIGGISLICIAISAYSFYYTSLSFRKTPRDNVGPWPADTADNLFWIVQISDIHISRYWDPQRAPDFKDFCSRTLNIIKPDIVLVTGDLTDAKSKNKFDSQQYEDEWQTYQSIIDETEVTKRYVWLDIRGNHDAFDVLRVDDPNSNLYLKYSGDKGKLTSKVYHLKKPYGKYSFIPVDATMLPGPRRPYNFAGYLSKEKMESLNSFQNEASQSNLTIWYSHYPTASITSQSPGVRNLVGQTGALYLAGHLHTLGGLSRSLYAMNSRGFLELELIDWLWERTFRIIAVDHDLVSFTDMKYNQWPGIVLTNPKAASYMLPKFEPIERISNSSHIRFLIFDPWHIEEIKILIDGLPIPYKPHQVSGTPLWVCRWDSKKYSRGMHKIDITVSDSEGNIETLSQQFSLDVTWTVDFGWLSPFVLLTDFGSVLFFAFHSFTLGCVVAITLLRMHNFKVRFSIIPKLRHLLQDNCNFYGLIAFLINISVGPWFVGEIIRGKMGICFSYGVFVDGVLQPEDITLCRDGIRTVAIYYLPSLYLLAKLNYASDVKGKNTLQKILRSPPGSLLLAYILFIVINFYAIWSLYQSYGYVATIFSPSKLWWTVFLVFLTIRIYYKTV